MKKCNFLGHSLRFFPEKRGQNNSIITKQEIACMRPGCGFSEIVLRDEVPGELMVRRKYRDAFWNSSTFRAIINFLVWVLVGLTVLAGILAITYWVDLSECNAYGNMGIEVRYNFWTECMAKHPKLGWLPIDDYFRTINLYVP